MEIIREKNKRGQLMTLSVLLIFVLMFSILLVYTETTVNYNNLAQNVAIESGNTNYGQILGQEATLFAKSSLRNALATLTTFESSPSMRKGIFITNTSNSLVTLMINGTISGVAANSATGNAIRLEMNNVTLYAYNSQLIQLLNISFRNIVVNETTPQIFQSGPYNISVRYVENVRINSSGNMYTYSIPVNASISLNGTPDLFYAQQGVYRPITPSGLYPASMVGGGSGAFGNTTGFAYGTIDVIPSGTSCAGLSSVTAFSSLPLSKTLILATPDARSILTACGAEDIYGGVITYNGPYSSNAGIPYVVYNPSNVPILSYLQTGQQVMLYGPTLSVLNMSGLIGEANNESYYPSQLTPSYIARSQENLSSQSAQGIFTLGGYDRETAYFTSVAGSGLTSLSKSFCANTNGHGGFTMDLWVNFNSLVSGPQYLIDCANIYGVVYRAANTIAFGYQATSGASTPAIPLSPNQWYNLVLTYNGVGNTEDTYVNGKLVSSNSVTYSNAGSSNSLWIGDSCGCGQFVGQMANIQIYNESLSSAQAGQLYAEGLEGLPISNASLAGWWSLNGNSNDISGYGITLTPTNVVYVPLKNYTRDGIFMGTVAGPYAPLPGVLDCLNNQMCSNPSLSQIYLGGLPLLLNNNVQGAVFNGGGGYINAGTGSSLNNLGMHPSTWSFWIYPYTSNSFMILAKNDNNVQEGWWISNEKSGSSPGFGVSIVYSGTDERVKVASPPVNTWTYVTIVTDGSTTYTNQKIYFNGVLQTITSGVSGSGSQTSDAGKTMYIGYNYPATEGGATYTTANATLADIQIYNASLSQGQISQLYGEGIDGSPVAPQNLTAWWPLDGDFMDYSGRGNSGTSSTVSFVNLVENYTAPGFSTVSGYQKELQAFGFS